MSDFFQNGVITTLHRLKTEPTSLLEDLLILHAKERPIALVLPALFPELKGAALPKIVEELKGVPYLHEIVITLDRATETEFEYAKKFFRTLPQKKNIIWNNGPRIKKLYQTLNDEFSTLGEPGKGRSAWLAYGFILAKHESKVIVLHDCDILTYNRDMLTRLCFPVTCSHLNYEFCKGYYTRVTDRLHGRVTRLFVTPLIRSLMTMIGGTPFLQYLDSFRYPLAGEFAMLSDLALRNRIPSDWGLEVGVLSEVYRNCALNLICQVDLADNYEHKHQEVSAEDTGKGLMKVTIDIAKTLFRNLASQGVVYSGGFFNTLRTVYVRKAQDMLKQYQDDASINSLIFERHNEANMVEAFSQSLKIAGEQILEDPLGIPLIPNWSRVISAIPDFYDLLIEAVEKDNST
jgi:glucosyl-3-phosphoglycerate synthase